MTKWGREMTQSAVIVTGAANGIRYACAHDLLTDGVPVAATDIGEIPAALVNVGDCLPLSFDVSAEQSCQEAVAAATARFGGVGALIHFAGIHHTKTWDEFTGEDFAHVYAVNVTGFFLMARAAAGQMQDSGGSIVLTASGGV
ncbi:MAG: SDR family NAD(P)-dependent oxidoreductase [Pseudomonadota bacterium]|nr:SDR family NAD(P)-dependent oxidoreductase [Pseudomonadota bacterium]